MAMPIALPSRYHRFVISVTHGFNKKDVPTIMIRPTTFVSLRLKFIKLKKDVAFRTLRERVFFI